MAQFLQRSLLLLLLLAILSWGAAQRPTTDLPYSLSPSLLPVMCILLAIVILALCLIGFTLICLSALATTDDEEEGVVVCSNHGRGKTVSVYKHASYERDDPPSPCMANREGLALKVQQKPDYSDSNDVIINMEPYYHGSELKNSTRSLLQGLKDIPVLGSAVCASDRNSTEASEGRSRHLERNVASEEPSDRHKEGSNELQLWRVPKSQESEQAFRHLNQDTELIIRG